MREIKRVTIISATVSVISVLLVILAHIIITSPDYATKTSLVNNAKLLYDISLAIFGGAIVGLIVSVGQYLVQKRKYLEKYYFAFSDISFELLKNAQFLEFEDDIELVKACFEEELQNHALERLDKPLKSSAKNALCGLYANMVAIRDTETYDKVSEEWYQAKLEGYKKQIDQTINGYLAITENSLDPLQNAYSNVDFILGNRKLRGWIYKSMHKSIVDEIISLKQRTFYFQKEDKGHFYYRQCLYFLIEMNGEWFKTEYERVEDDNEICEVSTVFASRYHELATTKEQLRCKIYNKQFVAIEPFEVSHRSVFINKSTTPSQA